MIKRYKLDAYDSNKYGEFQTFADMKESEHGDYVRHSDYEKLQLLLEKAEDVVGFYADKLSWKQLCNCGDGTILIDIEDDDQEDLGRIYGGRAARQYFKDKEKK